MIDTEAVKGEKNPRPEETPVSAGVERKRQRKMKLNPHHTGRAGGRCQATLIKAGGGNGIDVW